MMGGTIGHAGEKARKRVNALARKRFMPKLPSWSGDNARLIRSGVRHSLTVPERFLR